MEVNLFASLSQSFGDSRLTLGENPLDIRALIDRLLSMGNTAFQRDLVTALGVWPSSSGSVRDMALTILVNGRNIAFLGGLDTALRPGDVVTIIPPVAGG